MAMTRGGGALIASTSKKYLSTDGWAVADSEHDFLNGVAEWATPELASYPFEVTHDSDGYHLDFPVGFWFFFEHKGEYFEIGDEGGDRDNPWKIKVNNENVYLVANGTPCYICEPGSNSYDMLVQESCITPGGGIGPGMTDITPW